MSASIIQTERESALTVEWDDWRERMWNALEEKLGYPGLAMFEQEAWRSHNTGRCARCGETGEIKYERPMLAQAVPHYWLCQECVDHYAA